MWHLIVSIQRMKYPKLENKMLHDHIINFLEAAVVFLLLTNAISAATAISAVRLLNLRGNAARTPTAIERKLSRLVGVDC
jgi:hypothetical protein